MLTWLYSCKFVSNSSNCIVQVVAANMVGMDDSLSQMDLLCTIGWYQEVCSQVCVKLL